MRRIWGDRGIRWPGLRSDAVYDGGNERGAILVLFSLVLGLILLISVIVVDVGNWNVHAKRLQTLVDAGAFAGATKFVGCSFQFGDPVAANAAIKATALGYSGDTARDPATLNLQEQEPDDVRVVLNSARYWADGDPMTGIGLDDTLDHDNSLLTPAGDPCSTKTLDVKATDDDAPLLFGFLPMVIDPKRKAKVEIRQIKEQSGMLPWAVPDIEPEAVVAIFVDEINGDVLASQLLMQADDPGLPFSEWKTSAFEETVDIANENTGVVILVSKVDDDPLRTGSLAQICSQDPSLVTCYAGSGQEDGLTFIHGWSDLPGTLVVPQIRDVSLFAADCDEFSAPYFLRSAEECAIGAEAVIDFGFNPDPTPAPPAGISAVVKLRGPGCGNRGCDMDYVGEASAENESIWRTSELSTLDPRALGRQNYSVSWKTKSPVGVDRSGTFGGVAHPYVADERSGPIDYLKITTSDPTDPADPPILDPNSRNYGPPLSVIVTVGVRKPLRIEDPLVPPMLLRVANPSGSQNQAFDCDKNVNFATEIENGCMTTYGLNYDDWDTEGRGQGVGRHPLRRLRRRRPAAGLDLEHTGAHLRRRRDG